MIRRTLVLAAAIAALAAPKSQAEDGFRPLFNGKDLAGWVTPRPTTSPCSPSRTA